MTFENHLPTIAILGGTGNEGPGLAMRWVMQGYPIIIGSRKTEKALRIAGELNQKLGIESIRGMENGPAARSADICVLTVVQSAHQAAIESLKEDLRGKILVDATARVDFRNPFPPSPPSAARLASSTLGDQVRVVAAFQNVSAASLRKNLDQPLEEHVLMCADDLDAYEEVSKLAESIGMSAYYAGNLDNAIVLEGLTLLLINVNMHYESRSASIQITGINEQ
jgi:NADPH-dependent F420 reductase